MQTTPWESELTQALSRDFGDSILAFETYAGQNFLTAKPASVIPILESLKTRHEFDYLVDITAVDYPPRPERFDLIYILYSHPRNERVRVKTRLMDGEPTATVVPVFAGANWLEREVFDMFGIVFSGHPDLRRILLPEDWTGHPLRRDYSILGMDQEWVKNNLGIESGQ